MTSGKASILSKPERKPSPKWATAKQIADLFRVPYHTVLDGSGAFKRLRRVHITNGRIIYLREDVERLYRETAAASGNDTG